ncbi:hypothetical protein B0H10DRAFT_1820893 [Mycena sp. CBHHK59/15]|nr:hypothetical protein B0H10DRAFT_1820893 [Mycena sp. CBHHK59/15]
MQTQGGATSRLLHEIDGIHDRWVCPMEEEHHMSLRRVTDKIPWNAYCALLSVNFPPSYACMSYKCIQTNFIQYLLPPGSHASAGLHSGQSGTLGKGRDISRQMSILCL